MGECMSSNKSSGYNAKTIYSSNCKGPMKISKLTQDKFVEIVNTGTKEENLFGWKVTRKVDDKEITQYELDSRFSAVRPGQKISLYPRNMKPQSASSQDFDIYIDNWGDGATAETRLIDKEGEMIAEHVQRTSHS